MSKFQPGDSAIIISGRLSFNIGKQVELVLADCTKGEVINPHDNTTWINDGCSSWFVMAEKLQFSYDTGNELDFANCILVSESSLMPLKGDFTHEEEVHENTLPCV